MILVAIFANEEHTPTRWAFMELDVQSIGTAYELAYSGALKGEHYVAIFAAELFQITEQGERDDDAVTDLSSGLFEWQQLPDDACPVPSGKRH